MRRLFVFFLAFHLFACGTMSEIDIIDDITAPDYVSSSKARKLEIPPDLIPISKDRRSLHQSHTPRFLIFP